MAKDGEETRVFDYKKLQDRIAPKGGMDSKSLLKVGDMNLVVKMIKEKDAEISEVTKDVSNLQTQYKENFKEKENIILKLTKDNDDSMKKMILLESKIKTLEGQNEKKQTETVQFYEGKIKGIEQTTTAQVNETMVKKTELTDELEKMEGAQREKLKYELELMAWQQDCESLEKTIQEEKYRIEIEQARMKQKMEAEFDSRLAQFKMKAKQDAQRNIQDIERGIHYKNQELAEKTMSQRYTLDYYKREKARLEGDKKEMSRDIVIQDGTTEQYEQRRIRQTKKIKSLQEKIMVLEKSLQ